MKKIITYARKYPLPELGAYNMAEVTETIELTDEDLLTMKVSSEEIFNELRKNVLFQMDKDLAKAQTNTVPLKQDEVKPEESSTPWRSTKNPNIEWCPENEASAEDVKKALKGENNMWSLESENGYGLSIFRKLKTKEE